MRKSALLPFLALSVIIFAGAGACQAQKIEKSFDAMLGEAYPADGPGIAVLVASDDEVIYRKAFGMGSLELDVPLKPENVFEIGSVTKQFTAVAILMLEEQGKLSLDDDITKFFPDYPTHGHTITLHHLLTHTSGIKSYTGMEEWLSEWRTDFTDEELIDFFKYQPMDFAPGEEFRYNNSAFFMLGPIIEKASGLSYARFLDSLIFKPLGMKNSSYGSKTRLIHNRAVGYQKEGNGFKNAEFLSMTQPGAAGAIMSTVDDMFLWSKAIRNNTLVKKETIDKAFTNHTLNNGEKINYGYGWGINEINGSPTLEHSGGIFGYTSNGIYLPEENVYLIALTNRDDKSPRTITTRMAAMAIGKPFPDHEEKVEVPEEVLSSYTGVYDFEDGSTRYITFEDGQLYSQRSGSMLIKIFPQSETRFFYAESMATITFGENEEGQTTARFENRIDKTSGVKTDKPLPQHKEITVDPSILGTYVGKYELQPGFFIVVTLEDGHLMTQATGQEKFEVFPESETMFFLKVVDAKIEFLKNDTGKVDALMLYQGGAEMRAPRMD
jgi:CubicO group peptidase (beta-lactamase class C family)